MRSPLKGEAEKYANRTELKTIKEINRNDDCREEQRRYREKEKIQKGIRKGENGSGGYKGGGGEIGWW